MKKLVLALCFVVGFAAEAKTVNNHILIDGSVARCAERADLGMRAFRLSVVDSQKHTTVMLVESLVCVAANGKMIHVPYALGQSFEYRNDAGRTLSYEYKKAQIVVLNTEATAVLQAIALDSSLTNQEITINHTAFKATVFDVSLQAVETIKVDGKLLDQGLVHGGSYRITIK